MNPNEAGATEFLANLSPGMVVLIALALTVARLFLMRITEPAPPGRMPEVSPAARGIAEILESLIIAGVLVFLIIRPFFVQAFFIPSASMENTLLGHNVGEIDNATGNPHSDSVHDHIFVNKLIYRYSEPQRGDIIVFKAPKEADAESRAKGLDPQENVLIKRLIAREGDTVEVKDSAVYVNGKRQDEYHDRLGSSPYSIKEPMNPNIESVFKYAGPGHPITLKPGQLWVMGDNRNDSNDSRYWGPLERSRVLGKASFIFWPLDRIRVLH